MQIILLRHGQTEANSKELFYGFSESNLTDLGREQAKEAGLLLKKLKFNPTKIYVSERTRTHETLECLGFKINDATIDGRINERNMGKIEGMNYKEVNELFPTLFEDWGKDFANYILQDGESWKLVYDRVVHFLEEVIEKYKGTDEKILVVAHGGILACFWTYLAAGNFNVMFNMFFDNCAMMRAYEQNGKYILNGLFYPHELI